MYSYGFSYCLINHLSPQDKKMYYKLTINFNTSQTRYATAIIFFRLQIQHIYPKKIDKRSLQRRYEESEGKGET